MEPEKEQEPVPGPEHLISLKLEDGSKIDFSRTEDNEVHVCREGHCVILPKASAQVTIDLISLLSPLGKLEGGDEGEVDGE